MSSCSVKPPSFGPWLALTGAAPAGADAEVTGCAEGAASRFFTTANPTKTTAVTPKATRSAVIEADGLLDAMFLRLPQVGS